ncbi:hypothetical protein ASPWEDRAFT_39163 [Aspergillus wentii DTO 134E9]|uniref:Uncharacterized protein n=1 Tax=Aspergillus wentii DTO 134E9 TaxID=1073089 RepID=A0A1L9RRE3_ASPWE|nr:uncharacterized protein ASPWEDRAFT_39163 [Aspergillus wentii DTO 134E9]OJJ37472.1 hypothetical protein ASPWEDRAFT_39163 [Aspergillus wentii DTO 134E9]
MEKRRSSVGFTFMTQQKKDSIEETSPERNKTMEPSMGGIRREPNREPWLPSTAQPASHRLVPMVASPSIPNGGSGAVLFSSSSSPSLA